ncbi:MAG: class I SAM-dependent methyltransferase [Acidobacteriaceae bacterium]
MPVDLYDSAYSHYATDVYRQVRIATYGDDLGQTSWVTGDESREIPQLLELTPASRVLEIGCGSGGYALRLAAATGSSILGVDINEAGIRNASSLARERNLDSRASFQLCDVAKPLPFPDQSFDAAFANDVLCHITARDALLREIFRILKPHGRLLFSDALILGGAVTHQEIATRSSIGTYIFTPPGHNERLIEQAGFRLLEATDTTANAAAIAQRWQAARGDQREALIAIEGATNFEGLQQFLACVATLCSERRLLRFLYVAEKPD